MTEEELIQNYLDKLAAAPSGQSMDSITSRQMLVDAWKKMKAQAEMQKLYANAAGTVETAGAPYTPNFTMGKVPAPLGIQIAGAAPPEAGIGAGVEAGAASRLGQALGAAKNLAGKAAPVANGLLPLTIYTQAATRAGRAFEQPSEKPTIPINTGDPKIDFAGKFLSAVYGNQNMGIGQEWANKLIMAPVTIPAATIESTRQIGKTVNSLGDDFNDWWGKPQKLQSKADENKQNNYKTALEAWAANVSEQAQDEIKAAEGIQSNDNIPAPPMMQMPVGVDTSAVEEWMRKAAPTSSTEEEQKNAKYSSIAAAIGDAVANMNPNMSVAQILAQAGGSALKGMAAGDATIAKMKKEDQKAEQNYAALMAGNTLDLAKMKADEQNKTMEVAYKNSLLRHEYALQMFEKGQPKFLGMQGGAAVYQIKDGQGNINIKTFDTGLLQRQAMIKALGRENSGNPFMGDALAGAAAPTQDPMGIMGMVAAQLINSGYASSALGEKEFEALQTKIQSEMSNVPGTDEQKGKLYRQQLLGQVAGALMNDPSKLQSAARYSPYAALFMQRLNKGQ